MIIFPFYSAEFFIDAWISTDQWESSETNEHVDKENEREDWSCLPSRIWKDIFLRSSVDATDALRRATPAHLAIFKWRSVESSYWEKKCRAGRQRMPPEWIVRISRRFPQQCPLNWKDIFEYRLFYGFSPNNQSVRKHFGLVDPERSVEDRPLILRLSCKKIGFRSTSGHKKITDSNNVSITFLERLPYPEWILDIIQPTFASPISKRYRCSVYVIREYEATSNTSPLVPVSASLHGEMSVEGDWWTTDPESKDYIPMAAKTSIGRKTVAFSNYGSGLQWIRIQWQRESFDAKDERIIYKFAFPLECPPHVQHLL